MVFVICLWKCKLESKGRIKRAKSLHAEYKPDRPCLLSQHTRKNTVKRVSSHVCLGKLLLIYSDEAVEGSMLNKYAAGGDSLLQTKHNAGGDLPASSTTWGSGSLASLKTGPSFQGETRTVTGKPPKHETTLVFRAMPDTFIPVRLSLCSSVIAGCCADE